MLGREDAELRTLTWRDLSHPDDAHAEAESIAALMAGSETHFDLEKRVLRPDGRWFWASVSVTLQRDAAGAPTFVVGFVRDVTERVMVVTALREAEARLVRVIDASTDGHFEADFAKREVHVSARWNEIVGAPAIASTYTIASWEALVHADDVAPNFEAMKSMMLGASDRMDITYRLRLPDGASRWVRSRAKTVARDEAGRPRLVSGTTTDVHDQRTAQEQLLVASKLAALGTLVSGLAHEVNNPLAAQLAGTELALETLTEWQEKLRRGAPFTPDATRAELDDLVETLTSAQEGGQRVARIVRDMVAFGRPGASRALLRLRSVVDDAMRWVPKPLAATVDLAVEDHGSPEVLASAAQMSQVVQNLVVNALKATRPGARGRVLIRLSTSQGGQARLEVVDEGVGIPLEDRTLVFEPFFTTRPVGEGRGTGLGLAVCHSIVTAHQGTISVESAVGVGSTFTVELPAAPGGR